MTSRTRPGTTSTEGPADNPRTPVRPCRELLDCVLSCETGVGIIDDVHFTDPRRKNGLDVSNHLKWLANELPVTFIYVRYARRSNSDIAAELATDVTTVIAATRRRGMPGPSARTYRQTSAAPSRAGWADGSGCTASRPP
jgi:hypothetical protein